MRGGGRGGREVGRVEMGSVKVKEMFGLSRAGWGGCCKSL